MRKGPPCPCPIGPGPADPIGTLPVGPVQLDVVPVGSAAARRIVADARRASAALWHDPAGGRGHMEIVSRSVGPLATNVHVVADPATREAIAIDTAIPSLAFVTDELAARGWTLKLIVSTHGHWDHIGDNAALAATTAAPIAVHRLDRDRLEHPARTAPFEIPPSVPAVELAEGSVIRFGGLRLQVLHTPGHTEGSVSLWAADQGILFSGDTLFASGWGRVDLPGGSAEAMADSLARLAGLDARTSVLPGHGPVTTIGRERSWLDLVVQQGRLFA